MDDKITFPITPTSGGVIKLKNVICREQTIERYWLILQGKGISLYAERRFGKSSIIRKMAENPIPGFVTIYKSVQGVKSIEDFVEVLFEKAQEKKLFNKKRLESVKGIWNNIADHLPEVLGVKLGKINHVWQKKLVILIKNILQSNPNEKLVLFLDEFSLMLNEMSTDDAAILIGFLRDIVHDTFPDRLRFVYTGSISIDLILDKLKRAGHNLGDPLNHTERERVSPFDKEQTSYFCQCLELGCKIELDDKLRNQIFKITDGIPYFIDKIFDRIRHQALITRKSINDALDAAVNDPDDKSNLAYYYDRISDHYPEPEISHAVLLQICNSGKLKEVEIVDHITAVVIDTQPRQIKDEIQRLWKDGYLTRKIIKKERIYSFQYAIIKKWWNTNKA